MARSSCWPRRRRWQLHQTDLAVVNQGAEEFNIILATGCVGGPAVWEPTLVLDAQQAPYSSFQSLICDLPGSRRASLRGLTVWGG